MPPQHSQTNQPRAAPPARQHAPAGSGRRPGGVEHAETQDGNLLRPGVRKTRVHDARQTAATLLLEQGIGLQLAGELSL